MTRKKTIQSAARVAGKNGFSLISDDVFRKLYALLLQCRIMDQRLRANSTYERWAGREACTVATGICLGSGDSIIPTPRGLLARYIQSGSVSYGTSSPVDPSGQLAAATVEGLRHKLERLGNVSIVYANPNVGEPGRMREVFEIAADQQLPAIYVLEESDLLPTVCGRVPVIRVDRYDPVAVHRVAHESIVRAREGGGSTILECASWPGDTEDQDPIAKLEHYMADKGLFQLEWKNNIKNTCEATLGETGMSLVSESIKT